MNEPNAKPPPQADEKPPRQVTVQPQEPAPWKRGPPKQPLAPDKGARPVPEGEKDKRSSSQRDGGE